MFVSGGSRGLGAGLVVSAARAGYDVAFTYRSSREAAESVVRRATEAAPQSRTIAYELDVRDPDAVEHIGDRVLDDLDQVDVVVANAGVTRVGLAFSTSDDDWREVIDTNLTGAFWVTRQFLPSMLARRFGRLLFMSSAAAAGMSGDVAYCASKAGLIGLAKAMAKEYGRKGITSNALVLGLFETEMTERGLSASNREFYDTYCPVGRPGRIDELAAAVLHYAGEAGAFVTGQAIHLTGGLDWYK